MKTSTQETREKAIRAYEEGRGSQGKIAFLYGVSDRTLRNWLAVYRETGRTAPNPKGHPKPALDEKDIALLEKVLRENQDATQAELIELSGVKCAVSTLSKVLRRLDWRYKKNASSGRTATP